ncbi:hypothetical protein ACFE04_003092 [Oxalis oulophora]
MSTVAPQPPPPPPPQSKPNSNLLNTYLSSIDLTSLTQTELSTLSSLISPPSLSYRDETPISSTIDTSMFNESAGSRRQTYSRPSSSTHHRHRIAPGTTQNPLLQQQLIPPDDSQRTNHLIISSLKKLLNGNPRFSDIQFAPPRLPPMPMPAAPLPPVHNTIYQSSFTRKKRGRKPKVRTGYEVVDSDMHLQRVNKHGAEVDVFALADLDDPYAEEIRRRTEGMANEEQLLQFLSQFTGQWCSRRRKRRFIDAGFIGDTLPVGWKLLLGLKRKEGRSWVYVRRYVSPGGKHFLSCKEVSEYLQSYFQSSDVNEKKDLGSDSAQQQVHQIALENPVDVMQEEGPKQLNENKRKRALSEDNLKDVQIHALFECYKCNKSFGQKDSYLEHFSSAHQKSIKKHKGVGSTVGDGVIVTKDGKFECQFCHKVFIERRRYNGHVGIHVRNYVRGVGELPGISNLPRRKGEESPIPNMDALVETPKIYISENFTGLDDSVLPDDPQNMVSEPIITTSIQGSFNGMDIEDCINETKSTEELNQQNIDLVMTEQGGADINCGTSALNVMLNFEIDTADVSIKNKTDGAYNPELSVGESGKSDIEQKNGSELSDNAPSAAEHNVNVDFTDIVENSKPDKVSMDDGIEVEVGVINTDHENMEVDIDFGSLTSEIASCVNEDTVKLTSVNDISASSLIETQFKVNEHENVASFEGIGLDEIDNLQFSLGNEQESLFLSDAPVCATNVEMGSAFDSSTQFEATEEVMLDVTATGHQHVTECVWCGMKFSHETVDSEEQSDSVGYMCPACKSKISGQFE